LLIKNKRHSNFTISTNAQSNQIIIGGNKAKRLKARFLIIELDKQFSIIPNVFYKNTRVKSMVWQYNLVSLSRDTTQQVAQIESKTTAPPSVN
jgi:hypothetical protein